MYGESSLVSAFSKKFSLSSNNILNNTVNHSLIKPSSSRLIFHFKNIF